MSSNITVQHQINLRHFYLEILSQVRYSGGTVDRVSWPNIPTAWFWGCLHKQPIFESIQASKESDSNNRKIKFRELSTSI